jgi:hypothetical protein
MKQAVSLRQAPLMQAMKSGQSQFLEQNGVLPPRRDIG